MISVVKEIDTECDSRDELLDADSACKDRIMRCKVRWVDPWREWPQYPSPLLGTALEGGCWQHNFQMFAG